MNAPLRLIALMLALLALLAAPAPGLAQDQPQDPTTPETAPQQQGDDDEELGEEIPDEDEEPEEPGGGSGGSGGGGGPPEEPTTPATQTQLPRTGQDPLPILASGVVLLVTGLVLRKTAARP